MPLIQTATSFTPLAAALGGSLIGLSAVVLMLTLGRIAGASTIFAGLLSTRLDGDFRWQATFILGLLVGAAFSGLYLYDPSEITFSGGPLASLLGGLLVGSGVTLGSGCTSGHGICGMARLSKRSFAATCVFMAVAIATVIAMRHVVGG
jgi:uncharacterized membrane protein YedE/YeeE